MDVILLRRMFFSSFTGCRIRVVGHLRAHITTCTWPDDSSYLSHSLNQGKGGTYLLIWSAKTIYYLHPGQYTCSLMCPFNSPEELKDLDVISIMDLLYIVIGS